MAKLSVIKLKSALFYIFLILLCVGCNKGGQFTPSLQIKPLVGVWKLSEIQIVDGRDKLWQQVPYFKENDIEIRADGVFLDNNGERVCCHPKELNINGSIEQVNNYLSIRERPNCNSACVTCQVWTIGYIEGELTLTGCLETDVKKYRR